MKNLLLVLTVAVATAGAQPLSKSDQGRALSELHATSKQFVDSLAGLSDAQLNFKAAPERWSIAECAAHIALSEDLLFGMLVDKIMKSPADPSKMPAAKDRDAAILKAVADRSKKSKAPNALQPAQKFASTAEALSHFKQSREKTLEYIRTTQDELRTHFTKSGEGPDMDAYQWILLISAHTDRHVQQIQEVKAAPGYPAR
jgi:hypothetical protein